MSNINKNNTNNAQRLGNILMIDLVEKVDSNSSDDIDTIYWNAYKIKDSDCGNHRLGRLITMIKWQIYLVCLQQWNYSYVNYKQH